MRSVVLIGYLPIFILLSSVSIRAVFTSWPTHNKTTALLDSSDHRSIKQLPDAILNLFEAEEKLYFSLKSIETEDLLLENYTKEKIFDADSPEDGIACAVGSVFSAYSHFAFSLQKYAELIADAGDLQQLMSYFWSLKISVNQLIEGGLLPQAAWQNIQLYNEDFNVIIHGFETNESVISACRAVTVIRIKDHFAHWNEFLRLLRPFKETVLLLPFLDQNEDECLIEKHRALKAYWSNWEELMLSQD